MRASFRPRTCKDGVLRGMSKRGPSSLSVGRKAETRTQNLLGCENEVECTNGIECWIGPTMQGGVLFRL